jgi:hypothetical protein
MPYLSSLRHVAFTAVALGLTAYLLQICSITSSTAQSDRNAAVQRKSDTFIPIVPDSYQSELVSLSIRGKKFKVPKAYLYSYDPEFYDLKDGDDVKDFCFRMKWPQMTPIITNGGDPDIRPYSGNVIVVRGLRFGRLETYQPSAITDEERISFESSLDADELARKAIFERTTQLRLVYRQSRIVGGFWAELQHNAILKSSFNLRFYWKDLSEPDTLENISKSSPRIGLVHGWVEAIDGSYGYYILNEGSHLTDWTDRSLQIDKLIRSWMVD